MKCDDCEYAGVIFDHLKDYDGIANWRACMYPFPYHVSDQAVPIGVEYNCQVFKRKEQHK